MLNIEFGFSPFLRDFRHNNVTLIELEPHKHFFVTNSAHRANCSRDFQVADKT